MARQTPHECELRESVPCAENLAIARGLSGLADGPGSLFGLGSPIPTAGACVRIRVAAGAAFAVRSAAGHGSGIVERVVPTAETLVADVHTDLNTQRVLEEGTGPLEWLLAVTRLPDGTLSVAVGPVFSFKEFVHPLSDRLPNEKWRGELRAGEVLPAPRWWTEDRPLANGFELPSIQGAKAP